MPLKACLLDLDNTLYDYEAAHAPALAAAAEWFTKQFGIAGEKVADTHKLARKQIHEQLHGLASSHSRLLYFQRMMEILSLRPLVRAVDAEQVYWSNFLDAMQLRHGAMQFLEDLRNSNIPVALVTDLTTEIQLRKLEKLGLEPFLQQFVTSEEAGAEKPDQRIFQLACKKLGMTADQVFMIGDSFERDVQGAANLGIPCIWFVSPGTANTDRTTNPPTQIIPCNDFEAVTKAVHSLTGALSQSKVSSK